MIRLKTKDEIEIMRRAGSIVAGALDMVGQEIKPGMTIRKALQKLNIEPDSVLITRNGELITDDEIIRVNDEIKLVPVISGG